MGFAAWRERRLRYLQHGLAQRGLFLLAVWGVTVTYLLFNLAVILAVLW